MTKEKKELNPKIEEIKNKFLSIPDNKNNELEPEEEINIYPQNETDSFFKTVLKNLFSKKDISLKTEYLTVMENYTGSKLAYLSQYGGMPYLKEFVTIFEEKRVSLKRQGRQEILLALQNRQQEEQEEKNKKIKQILGL